MIAWFQDHSLKQNRICGYEFTTAKGDPFDFGRMKHHLLSGFVPRNVVINIVYATVTPQALVKFKVSATARVDNGPNYFIDRGPMVNLPPVGASTPHEMGLISNRRFNMTFRSKKL